MMTTTTITNPTKTILNINLVHLTNKKVTFGDDTWINDAPIGYGSVQWDIVSGFYTPRVIGTLHLDDNSNQYGRIHISYWDGGGGYIDTRHGGTVRAPDSGHHSWHVDLSPLSLRQITEVHVCTEVSDNAIDWTIVDCATRYL